MDFSEKTPKPLIGFEPMTYALPWRYSTTELKGLIWLNSPTGRYVDKISICTYIIYISICTRLIVASGLFLIIKWICLATLGSIFLRLTLIYFIEMIPIKEKLTWLIHNMDSYQFDIKSISRYLIESCDGEILLVPLN